MCESNTAQAPLISFESVSRLTVILFDLRLTAAQLIATLNALADRIGRPHLIMIDLGTDRLPIATQLWAPENAITILKATHDPATSVRVRSEIERIVASQVRITY